MPYRMAYASTVIPAAGGTPLVTIGRTALMQTAVPEGDLTFTEPVFTQDEASSLGKAWTRRFQSSGRDVKLIVVGRPILVGAAVANPVRALTAAELEVQTYEEVDTLARGLRQRISLANREAVAAGAGLDADIDSDVVIA